MIEQLKAAGMTDEQIAAQTAEAAAALEQGRLQLAAGGKRSKAARAIRRFTSRWTPNRSRL